MGLFLYVTGPVNPTESSVDELVQRCEGVNNQSYVCESGHCCGVSQCCSYYYELWWFWLVWAIIFILSCCCVCHHRRTKHRLQQQQRQHEINLIAYREAHNYTSPPFYFRFLPHYLLPEYEEAMHRPATPPPPYSTLNAAPTSCCSSPDPQEELCPSRQATPVPSVPSSSPCPAAPVSEEFGGSGRYVKDESKSLTGRSTERRGGSERVSVPPDDPCDSDKQETHGKAEEKEKEKERGSGRRRRFTGDSGIEVCVCAGGPECRQPKELESLLSGDEEDDLDDSAQFCRGCGLPECEDAEEEEEQEEEDVERGLLGPDRGSDNRNSPLTQPHPVCLYLQTINEQEGPHCSDAEPQN